MQTSTEDSDSGLDSQRTFSAVTYDDYAYPLSSAELLVTLNGKTHLRHESLSALTQNEIAEMVMSFEAQEKSQRTAAIESRLHNTLTQNTANIQALSFKNLSCTEFICVIEINASSSAILYSRLMPLMVDSDIFKDLGEVFSKVYTLESGYYGVVVGAVKKPLIQ